MLFDLKLNGYDLKKQKSLSWEELIELFQKGELKEWQTVAVERHKTIDAP